MQKIEKIADLVESVKDALFEGILTGELRPGDKLQQAKLAEKLGVSRQPVSHALRLLGEQGILTAIDARSLTVAEPDMKSMLQMLEVRCELDGYAAALAARNFAYQHSCEAREETIAEIHVLLSSNLKNDTVSEKRNVLDDIRFHELVRELSGNPFIQESLGRYVLHHNRFIYLMAKDMDENIWPEHAKIMKAIESANETEARKVMRDHIARGTVKLTKLMETEAAL